MKKAIIYCRVSSKKQKNNGASLENQETACKSYCKNNNIEIIGVYQEAFTGKDRNRPIFNQAIDNAKMNKVQYFIIFDIDRFSREGYGVYSEIKEDLFDNGIQLKDSKNIIGENQTIITNDIVDMSQYKWNIENTSEYAEVMISTQAKIEGKKIIQRTIPREIQLEQEGYQVRASNYGFMNKKIKTPNGKKTIQVAEPYESKWVQEMFNNRAKGYLTDKQIVENLNAKGCKKRTGKPMTTKYMQEILVKPIYAGILSTKWTGNKAIKTPYEGLVSIKLWNQANKGKLKITEIDNKEVQIEYIKEKVQVNKTPIMGENIYYNPNFCFSKVLECPICKGTLTGNISKSGNGSLHHYYQCRGKKGAKHKSYTLKKDIVHKKIFEIFNSIKINNDVLELFSKISEEVFNEIKHIEKNNKSSYEKQLEKLKNEKYQILEEIDKVINFPIILERKNNRLEEIESEKYKIKQKLKEGKNNTNLQRFLHYSRNVITHIDKLALQKDKPEYIKLAFEMVFDGKITYENIHSHTTFFHSFYSNLSQQKKSHFGDFYQNSKWQPREESNPEYRIWSPVL